MKKFLSLILACSFLMATPVYAAYSDSYILKDTVQATYSGHKDGRNVNKELQFIDLKSTYGYDIAKLGSLNLIKGYEKNFQPNSTASNLDVISILLNMEGYEPEAVTLAAAFQTKNPQFNSLESKELAYIELATKYGYITEAEGTNAIQEKGANGLATLQRGSGPKTQINPNNENFTIDGNARRDNIAEWISTYLTNIEATLPITPNVGQYSANDHANISAQQIPAVETVLANGIMTKVNGNFEPAGTLIKGELAHTMVSLEPYFYADRAYELKTGIVGAVKTDTNKSNASTKADVYVRGTDGKTYVLTTTKYTKNNGLDTEIPTYKNGKMINNLSLAINDSVEFVVSNGTGEFPAGTAMFTGVLSSNNAAYATGKLKNVDLDTGAITIAPTGNNDTSYTYQMVDGLYDSSGLILGVGTEYERYAPDEIPYGAKYKLTLKGQVVTDIKYIGQDTIINESRGIVIENQPDFGYMVVLGNDGVKRVYKYYPDEVVVEKQPYYDHEDYVGNFDEFFSYDGYDPRDATVDQIEAGDLVFFRPSATDKQYVDYISVTPYYISRTGVINKVTVNDGYTTVLVTFDNGSVSSYQVGDDVLVRKDNSLKDASFLEPGDNAKFLINEAIIDAGQIVESIKEIVVEEQGHLISDIVKGELTGFNSIQGELSLANAQTLKTNGWANNTILATYPLKSKNEAPVYINGTQTNVTNLNRLLKNNDDFEVYMAVEQNYSGPTIKYVTAYDGRDTLLQDDMITNISPSGKLILQSAANEYAIKDNAIIVKNDKLVSKSALSPYDMVQVSLNGGEASVIKVIDSIENTGIQVARGRIQAVDENKSFTVKSLVLLENNQWTYSPLERTYVIDEDTIYLTSNGTVNNINTFLGYTENSAINKVYNIIADGTYAKYIIESPYVNENLNGTVYKVEGNNVYLKDVSYYDKDKGSWQRAGIKNNSATVTLMPNSVTIKNSEVINPNKIEVGDRLFVKTNALNYKVGESLSVTGYINFVENK